MCGGGLGHRPGGVAPWGVGGAEPGARRAPAALMRTTGRNEKFETFRSFKNTGQLAGSNKVAKPSVQRVQYRVLRNGFETLASMCVRGGSSGALGCTHKIAIGDSDLINVRIGPLCGLKSDISRGPRSTMSRHSPLTAFQIAPVIRPPIQAPLLHGWELNDAATLWELQIASDAMSLDA